MMFTRSRRLERQTILIALLSILLLSSCCKRCCRSSSCAVQEAPGEKTVAIAFTEKNDRAEITLERGKTFRLELRSNPTTGFDWHFADLDDTMIEVVQSRFERSSTGGQMGAGGVRIWELRALKAGKTRIHLDYYRSWEGVEKAAGHFELAADIEE